MAKRMDSSEGHATHYFCGVCKEMDMIGDTAATRTYRLIRASYSITTKKWQYASESPMEILVCSNCRLDGEPEAK